MDLVQIDDAQMLVVECMFSRFVETQLLKSKGAEEVYRACCEILLDRYGIPELIRTDNGNEFSALGAASFQQGFEWRRCAPHSPQSQGMCERANQSILNEITKLRAEHGYGVDDARRIGTRIYNAKKHKATGYSPYSLVFGQEPNDPDLVIAQKKHGKVNLKSRVNMWIAERAARDRVVFREALERDKAAKEQRSSPATGERFRVGDLVLIPRVNRLKTEPRRQGPYEVVQVRDGNVYRLKDITDFRKPRILRQHRQLTPYVSRDDGRAGTSREFAPPVQQNPGADPPAAVRSRGRPPKPAPIPRVIAETEMVASPRGASPVTTSQETHEIEQEIAEADMSKEEGEDEQMQEESGSAQERDTAEDRGDERMVEPETMSEEFQGWLNDLRRQRRNEESRERRNEFAEEPRRSKRTNKGVPPVKLIMDLIGKWAALKTRTIARLQNWERSHLPWKNEAARRLKPLVLGGKSAGRAVKT